MSHAYSERHGEIPRHVRKIYCVLSYFLYHIHSIFARFEMHCVYIFARKEKQRTEPKLARFLVRLRITKIAETSLERARRKYERCTCVDLLKNILPIQLLRLYSSSYFSRFSFSLFLIFLYISRSV